MKKIFLSFYTKCAILIIYLRGLPSYYLLFLPSFLISSSLPYFLNPPLNTTVSPLPSYLLSLHVSFFPLLNPPLPFLSTSPSFPLLPISFLSSLFLLFPASILIFPSLRSINYPYSLLSALLFYFLSHSSLLVRSHSVAICVRSSPMPFHPSAPPPSLSQCCQPPENSAK